MVTGAFYFDLGNATRRNYFTYQKFQLLVVVVRILMVKLLSAGIIWFEDCQCQKLVWRVADICSSIWFQMKKSRGSTVRAILYIILHLVLHEFSQFKVNYPSPCALTSFQAMPVGKPDETTEI